MYYETSWVFYIPEPLARGYKTNNEFHNTSYGMKIHLRFFLSHELTRNEQITRWNRLFPRIGDGWHRNLLRFDKQVRMMQRYYYAKEITFHYRWNQKDQEEHVCDVITKANSLFDNLRTFTNAQWYSSDTEKLLFACADRYVTCCHKI